MSSSTSVIILFFLPQVVTAVVVLLKQTVQTLAVLVTVEVLVVRGKKIRGFRILNILRCKNYNFDAEID